ncbi:MAG: hypothetical protein R3Y45_05430 [Bacillota bacterium]
MLKFFNTQIGSIIFLAVIAILAVVIISLAIIKGVKTKKFPTTLAAFGALLLVLVIGIIVVAVQMGNQVPSATPTPIPYENNADTSIDIVIPDLEYVRSGDVVTLVYISADNEGCYITDDEKTIDLSTGEPVVSLTNQAVLDLFYSEVDTTNAICIIAHNWQFYAVEEVDGELFVGGLEDIYMSFEDFCKSAVSWKQQYPEATGGPGLA